MLSEHYSDNNKLSDIRGGMMIQRYTEIDQPHAVSEWGMTEDDNGKWVKYDDIKHLLSSKPEKQTDRSEDVKKCPDYCTGRYEGESVDI